MDEHNEPLFLRKMDKIETFSHQAEINCNVGLNNNLTSGAK